MRCAVVLILLGACLGCASSPPPDDAPSGAPSSRFAEFAGGKVHYIDAGAGGTALVLVHGWACDGRVWRAQMEYLSGRHRLLVVDLPGHGRSDEPTGDYSMDLFAGATQAVMTDAGVERAVLIGHSNGVPVVRQFYRRYPDQVAGMLLIDGALRAVFDEKQATAALAMFQGDDYRDRITAMISSMPAPNLGETQLGEILAMALEQPHAAVVGGIQASLAPEVWEADPIDTPLLLLLADQPTWNDEYEAFVRKLAPQVDYRVWGDGTGHFLMLEQPEAFNLLALEFAANANATH